MSEVIYLKGDLDGSEPKKQYAARDVNGVYPLDDHVTFHTDAGPVKENDLVLAFTGEEKPRLGRLVKVDVDQVSLMSLLPPHQVTIMDKKLIRLERVKYESY
jgi:hypothetical protein